MAESKFSAEKCKWSEKSKKQLDLTKVLKGRPQIRDMRDPLRHNPLKPSKALRGGAVDQPFPPPRQWLTPKVKLNIKPLKCKQMLNELKKKPFQICSKMAHCGAKDTCECLYDTQVCKTEATHAWAGVWHEAFLSV